ncbi:MAG: YggT family protein [Pseudomonadota bacterium]|jgi:YggT family protein
MGVDALQFLLDVLVQSFAAVLLLRFHLQWLRVPLRNPIGEFIFTVTDFIVLRARRYIPSAFGFDTSTLLLSGLTELFYLYASLTLHGFPFQGFPLPGLLALTAVGLLRLSIYLLIGATLAQAILSWVNPHTPIAPVLNAATYPFLQPLRRLIPVIGNIDFSALALFIICQLILIVPLGWLDRMAMQLF